MQQRLWVAISFVAVIVFEQFEVSITYSIIIIIIIIDLPIFAQIIGDQAMLIVIP